jgi:hypothetical protein
MDTPLPVQVCHGSYTMRRRADQIDVKRFVPPEGPRCAQALGRAPDFTDIGDAQRDAIITRLARNGTRSATLVRPKALTGASMAQIDALAVETFVARTSNAFSGHYPHPGVGGRADRLHRRDTPAPASSATATRIRAPTSATRRLWPPAAGLSASAATGLLSRTSHRFGRWTTTTGGWWVAIPTSISATLRTTAAP